MARTAAAAQQQEEQEPKNETPRERFIRLIESRTSKALTSMEQVRGLANRDRYEYGEEDIEKVTAALRAEVDRIEETLRAGKIERGVHFSLVP